MTYTDTSSTDEPLSPRQLRLRAVLADYRLLVLFVLVVVCAAGLWLSYGAYAEGPPETTEEHTVEIWSTSGTVGHSATAANETTLYPEGVHFSNEPVYFATISPTADVRYRTSYDAPTGEANVSISATLVVRAVEDETVYWQDTEPAANTTATGVEPGEPVYVDFEVPVADLGEHIDRIEAEFGASPGETEMLIDVETEFEGTIADETQSAQETDRIHIDYDGNTYAFGNGGYKQSYDETRTETVEVPPGPARTAGGPLLAVVGFVGLLAVSAAWLRWPDPTRTEREWLQYLDDREEYDELVTTADVPTEVGTAPTAELSSFGALARLAIDVEAALLYDPRRDQYLVRDDELLYVFSPPALQADTAGELDFNTPTVTPDDHISIDVDRSTHANDGAVGDSRSERARDSPADRPVAHTVSDSAAGNPAVSDEGDGEPDATDIEDSPEKPTVSAEANAAEDVVEDDEESDTESTVIEVTGASELDFGLSADDEDQAASTPWTDAEVDTPTDVPARRTNRDAHLGDEWPVGHGGTQPDESQLVDDILGLDGDDSLEDVLDDDGSADIEVIAWIDREDR